MEISKNVVSKRMQDEEVILELKSGTYFGLNETGTFLFEQLKRGTSANELAAALVNNFDIDAATAKKDVQGFLKDLKEQSLISEA